MHKELKKAIINWLLDNENKWQRVNACHEEFRLYIYNAEGNYLIGGDVVSNFIKKADDLLYGGTIPPHIMSYAKESFILTVNNTSDMEFDKIPHSEFDNMGVKIKRYKVEAEIVEM